MKKERIDNQHYSDKGGHNKRSLYWKDVHRVEKEVSRGLARRMRRVSESGKK